MTSWEFLDTIFRPIQGELCLAKYKSKPKRVGIAIHWELRKRVSFKPMLEIRYLWEKGELRLHECGRFKLLIQTSQISFTNVHLIQSPRVTQ